MPQSGTRCKSALRPFAHRAPNNAFDARYNCKNNKCVAKHWEDIVGPGIEGGLLRALNRVALTAVLALGATLYASGIHAQTTVRIANFQNTVALALYHGIDKGYYKEAGLDIELIKVASGAASVQAVAAGQADVGWAATAVPMFARANGVKIKMFMTVDQEGPPNHYGTFYIASGKSGVTDFKNIKGKTIVINAFGTAGELGFRERLQKAGVAWEDIKTVVVPFPQMPAALELGNGDVVCTIQPMAAAILANKAIDAKTLDKGTIMASATQASHGQRLLCDRRVDR